MRGLRQEVWRLALFPDGKTLASGAKDGTVAAPAVPTALLKAGASAVCSKMEFDHIEQVIGGLQL
jgi:WD40 repeat protein